MFADVMLPRSLIAPSVFAILGNKKGPATNGGAFKSGELFVSEGLGSYSSRKETNGSR